MNNAPIKQSFRWTLLFVIVVTVVTVVTVVIFSSAAVRDPIHLKKTTSTFGIDISHYQGHVNWSKVAKSDHEIQFVIMRSTMGDDKKDTQFDRNWKEAGENGFIRGAYHYYRPHENSTRQFKNYSKHVKLVTGDFPPVLDIEQSSPYGAENLRKGVLNWLKLAEEHYNVKPVIYTGKTFYNENLKGHVDGYPLWIASYSRGSSLRGIDWTIHQFSKEVKVTGIREYVDGNNFKGGVNDLKGMCIK